MGRDGSAERGQHDGRQTPRDAGTSGRPTLNSAVRRRRADRAFSIRLAGAIRQNERAIERLKR